VKQRVKQRVKQHLPQLPQITSSQELIHCHSESLLMAIEGGVLQRACGGLYCFAWAAVQLAGGGEQCRSNSLTQALHTTGAPSLCRVYPMGKPQKALLLCGFGIMLAIRACR
jgi:hypothetical protein